MTFIKFAISSFQITGEVLNPRQRICRLESIKLAVIVSSENIEIASQPIREQMRKLSTRESSSLVVSTTPLVI